MASIGKITSSGISIPNELTVAAAAVNFDFTLVKLEAPPSFYGLRDALSTRRRGEAEDGVPHMTARRLGALFESKVPSIDNLIDAYGTRVSEICAACDAKSMPRPDAGLFRAQTGPDGTSIWAGATSGRAALAIHLLACFLARMWKEHEAISIWVELVERRKQEIKSTFTSNNPTELTAMMAAQQVITRDHLTSWDASARAWLQTADSVKRLQQTQFNLIVNNLSISVNNSTDPYESVIKAWVSALETMDRLTQGISQRVHDGALLLAVSSWHLYPDMTVLVEKVKHVDQKDDLMRGSLITIAKPMYDSEREGVFWSLPLSRMRFYSHPEISERRLASDTSRVTMNEFLVVMLGAIVGGYVEEEDIDIREMCSLLCKLHDRFSTDHAGFAPQWLQLMATAASTYLDASHSALLHVEKLFNLGRRRGTRFLSTDGFLLRLLFRYDIITWTFRPSFNNPEWTESIPLLRNVAKKLNCGAEDLIIRYRVSSGDSSHSPVYVFASAIPTTLRTSKRTRDSHAKHEVGHSRWVIAKAAIPTDRQSSCNCQLSPSPYRPCQVTGTKCTEYCHPHQPPCKNFESVVSLDCTCNTSQEDNDAVSKLVDFLRPAGGQDCIKRAKNQTDNSTTSTNCNGCHNKRAKQQIESEGECCQFILAKDYSDSTDGKGVFRLARSNLHEFVEFGILCGDPGLVALFKRTNAPLEPKLERGYRKSAGSTRMALKYINFTLWKLDQVLFHPMLDLLRLSEIWDREHFTNASFRESITALAFVASLYQDMNGATISLGVLDLVVAHSHWARSLLDGRESYKNRTALTFACIGWFDSGHYNIVPVSLNAVFAVSSGDSIYVLSSLLEDPAKSLPFNGSIKRIFGNLGRSGLSFLEATSDPRLDTYKASRWHLVNHHPFNQQFQDSFEGTSLHLSYTDYELPVDIGEHGLRDTPVTIVEAIITLDDRGTRLGDLNIDLWTVDAAMKYEIMSACKHEDHSRQEHMTVTAKGANSNKWVMIDCWDEFLDFPTQQAIFRATGNWEARLAALAASVQMEKYVMLLPESPCLDCLAEALADGSLEVFDIIIA